MADNSIDQIIAGGAGASTRADFSGLSGLLDAYFKGKDQAYQQEGRDLFKGGVPKGTDGSVDYGAMRNALFQHGDVGGGLTLANAAAGVADRSALAGVDTPPSQSNIVSPPSSNRNAYTTVAPALGKGGQATPQQGGTTLMQVLTAQGIPNDQLGAAGASIARQLGVDDPNAPVNLQDPQVRNVLIPAVARLKQMGIGQVAPQGQPQAQVMAQGGPQPQMAPQQPAPMQPSPTQVDAQNDPILKRLTFLAASPDKATAAAAETRLKSYLAAKEPTAEMKNATASGMNLPAYQEKQGDLAAQQAGATERAKADVKEQQDYISQGKMAQQRLGTLNTISNIVSSDKNLDLGFGSETTLKVKMALEKAGMDFGDLSGSQLIQKLNGVLASESSKSFSTRPTQFEFKTFLANNPGLALDEKGNVRMLGILSQTAKREADLGKLARQNQDDWSKWDDVVEKYDQGHPIKDPTTGKVLSNHSIIAPAKSESASANQRFSSPSEVHAAVAAGKLKSGDSFVDPNGKTRYVP